VALANPGNLQGVLNRLVYASPLRGASVPVSIVNDSKINAWTDGQQIYVSSGLLKAFQGNTDLVASVFAHELGHILANHEPQGRPRQSPLRYLSYFTPALSLLPYGNIYGSVAGTAVNQGVQMQNYAYDRIQENEADAIGVYVAAKAGYNAMGLSQFFDYLGGSGFGVPKNISIPTSLAAIPQSAVVTLLSTSPLYRSHPPSNERKKIVSLMIQRKLGLITQDALRKESAWLAEMYETLEQRSPKN